MFNARRPAAIALTAATLASGTFLASGAQAATADTPKSQAPTQDTIWNLGYDAKATTTIKKMGTSTTTTGFNFSSVHVEKGDLSSDLMLKEFKAPVKIGGVRLAYATIAVEPAGKATGKIDTTTHTVTQNQQAYLHITDISLLGHGLINLAGKQCRTTTPANIPVSGKMNSGFDTLHLSGEFTIPDFANCGLITGLVNKQVAGPGNTLDLTLTPHA